MQRDDDAIVLLSGDHRLLERLFSDYERSDGASSEDRRALVDALSAELRLHISVEQEVLYPAIRGSGRMEATELLTEAVEEHDLIEEKLIDVAALDPSHESHDETVRELIALVRRHVAREELQLFPLGRAQLGDEALQSLAARVLERRRALSGPRDADNPGQPSRDPVHDWLVVAERTTDH